VAALAGEGLGASYRDPAEVGEALFDVEDGFAGRAAIGIVGRVRLPPGHPIAEPRGADDALDVLRLVEDAPTHEGRPRSIFSNRINPIPINQKAREIANHPADCRSPSICRCTSLLVASCAPNN